MGLLTLLGSEVHVKSNVSYLLLDLYTRVLKPGEDKSSNSPVFKLTVADMLVLSGKLTSHFFVLVDNMDG